MCAIADFNTLEISNDTLLQMGDQKRFTVVELPELNWPASLQLPSIRFRLFVAADSRDTGVDAVSEFASAALKQGMVYCCVWGPGCERFHDIVDEVVVEDRIGESRFVGPLPNDTIMTTWHDDESLEEAVDFFAMSAIPTEGFLAGSDFLVVVSVDNQKWADTASRVLQSICN